jgi:hypothetical protein
MFVGYEASYVRSSSPLNHDACMTGDAGTATCWLDHDLVSTVLGMYVQDRGPNATQDTCTSAKLLYNLFA